MGWESHRIELTCGHDGTGRFEDVLPGDAQDCTVHGPTSVKRCTRIFETRGSKDYQLGLEHEKEEKDGGVREAAPVLST